MKKKGQEVKLRNGVVRLDYFSQEELRKGGGETVGKLTVQRRKQVKSGVCSKEYQKID